LSLADTLIAKAARNASFRDMEDYIGNDMLRRWQDDFLKAPAWGATAKTTPPTPGLAARPDLAVTITWNSKSDVDLWVTEPGGEQCGFSHRQTRNGGKLHEDNTTGFGPEHYTIAKAPAGDYVI